MSKDVDEFVSRFFSVYLSSENKPGLANLPEISQNAWQSPGLNPPDACMKWWSTLTEGMQQKWLANPKTPTIYEAWCLRRMRQEATNFARTNLRLAGFTPDPAAEALAARYINGEIEVAEFVEVLKAEASDLS